MFLVALFLTYVLYELFGTATSNFLFNIVGATFGLDYNVINIITLVLLFVGAISVCEAISNLFRRY